MGQPDIHSQTLSNYLIFVWIRVSGLSPFLGDDNNETLSYVTTAEYDFEDEAFNDISNEAKDFIEKLLQKAPM